MGGWFERLVGLVKDLLRKCIPRTVTLSVSELTTMLCNVESILNSRPLTYLSSTDPELALTPAHLLGSAPSAKEGLGDSGVKSVNTDVAPSSLRKIFIGKNELLNKFWLCFNKQYLTSLREQHFRKSRKRETTPSVGDVCLLQNENQPIWQWNLVRITQLMASKDGQVRKVKIRTTNGSTLERAICHLVPLEVIGQ